MKDLDHNYRGSYYRNSENLHQWLGKSDDEIIIDPGVEIIDAHHHLFSKTKDHNFYTINDLRNDIQSGHHISHTIYVEGYQSGWRQHGPEHLKPLGEVEMIVAQSSEKIPTPFGWCNVAAGIIPYINLLDTSNIEPMIETMQALSAGRICGIRHVVACTQGLVGRFIKHPPQEYLLVHPAYIQGAQIVGDLNLSIDIWAYHTQLPEVIHFIDQCPRTKIIINHVGGLIGVDDFRSERPDELTKWRRDMKNIAERDNVYLKIGGLGMPMFGFGHEYLDSPPNSAYMSEKWAPIVNECIEIFGTSRCIFESNFPVDQQSCNYKTLWNVFKRITLNFSSDEKSDLYKRNAMRAYAVQA